MKFSRDAAISRIPAPHLLKQEQPQLAGASFRDLAKAQHRKHERNWREKHSALKILYGCK